MKKTLFGIFALATFSFGQVSRTCSESPQGLPSFNPDWYYSEFFIPDNYQVSSLYGGFDRPWYIPAHQDYIAQFYRPGQIITGLNDFQLFNYDLIDDPLYNREFNIERLNVFGEGILRLSAPLTHGVIWNEACVSIQPQANPETVPEPSALLLTLSGVIFLLLANRIKSTLG